MAKFNYKELARAVAASEIGKKRVQTVMNNKFELAKSDLAQEFDAHPVTQEIKAGVGANNVSETLDGHGDLFSFIGFEEGSDPVGPVRDVLVNETKLIHSTTPLITANKIQYKFSLRIPTESLKKAAPLPWEKGLSWVEGIEKGISGLGNFIAGRAFSRSGGGIQVPNRVRNAIFSKRKYLSEIFESFTSKFK